MFADAEAEKAALLSDIEALKEKVEHERQPNIVFEKQNDDLKAKVRTAHVQLCFLPVPSVSTVCIECIHDAGSCCRLKRCRVKRLSCRSAWTNRNSVFNS